MFSAPACGPPSAVVANGHAVVEAEEVAAADGIQQEIVAAKRLARVFASELRVKAQRLFQRSIRVGVPVDEEDDSGRVDVRPRLGLDPRAAGKGHGKRGRIAGMGLRDQVTGVERVGRETVQLAEEVTEGRFHGGRV